MSPEILGKLTMAAEEGYSNVLRYLINCERAKPPVFSERNNTKTEIVVFVNCTTATQSQRQLKQLFFNKGPKIALAVL